MRIFKGLENIHSVIDRHQAEWLREQGEESERPQRLSVEERIRRSFAESNGTGRFSADRFMGGHVHEKAEVQSESQNESQSESSVEVVNVIPQNDENHSWLYNEVLKAINAAIGDSKNTKVIAVFVPVVQNGKEFESLPVDETITINTDAEESLNQQAEPESEPSEAYAEPEHEEENEEIEIAPSPFMKEPEDEHAEETLTEEPEMPPAEQETEEIHEEPASVPEAHEEEHEPAAESEQEMPAMGEEFDLLPEGQSEPDAELAEAFQTIEEKLDDNLQEQEQEAYHPELEETFDEPEELPVIDESADSSESEDVMTVSKGEPLEYEEIELPEPLDDDDVVFDDSVFEDNLNDNDKPDEETDEEDEAEKETIIIEDKENEAKHDILKKHE